MPYVFLQNNKLSGVINNKILEYIYKVPLLSQEVVDELRNDRDLISKGLQRICRR